MNNRKLVGIESLLVPAESKIVLLVVDGLGGLSRSADGQTELETAATPNLDALAAEGICGLHQPVGPGITPGSGPGHLALFGYDPLRFQIGRGVLSALGIDFPLQAGDIAARGNFCTLNESGVVTDRRAGRITTEKKPGVVRPASGHSSGRGGAFRGNHQGASLPPGPARPEYGTFPGNPRYGPPGNRQGASSPGVIR